MGQKISLASGACKPPLMILVVYLEISFTASCMSIVRLRKGMSLSWSSSYWESAWLRATGIIIFSSSLIAIALFYSFLKNAYLLFYLKLCYFWSNITFFIFYY